MSPESFSPGVRLLLSAQTNHFADGPGTNWVDVSSSAQMNQMAMLMSATNGAVFFRLARPG